MADLVEIVARALFADQTPVEDIDTDPPTMYSWEGYDRKADYLAQASAALSALRSAGALMEPDCNARPESLPQPPEEMMP